MTFSQLASSGPLNYGPIYGSPGEDWIGRVIQRGGEELTLEKVPDRLTTRLQQPSDLTTLQEYLSPWRSGR
ncbi:MAG: hypothetical protein LVS60_13295 [Nodosilinea sp. LVE1205-7]|jgi:hypothetical protein